MRDGLKSSMRTDMCWSRPACSISISRPSFAAALRSTARISRAARSTANRSRMRTRCAIRRNSRSSVLRSAPPELAQTFADALAANFDAPSNVRDMYREGLDVSVFFPTLRLYVMWRDNLDRELSACICRAYNTWLADYCSYGSKRLRGVCLIPLQDPARAVEELRYAKEKLSLMGIFWRPKKLCGRTLAISPRTLISHRKRGGRSSGTIPCAYMDWRFKSHG